MSDYSDPALPSLMIGLTLKFLWVGIARDTDTSQKKALADQYSFESFKGVT